MELPDDVRGEETGTTCPCRLFDDTWVPGTPNASDRAGVTVGSQFSPDTNGIITGLRFFKGSSNTGSHIGSLWNSAGTMLATATFTNESVSGWQTVLFSQPVSVSAGNSYVVSYYTSSGYYSVDGGAFTNAYDRFPLHVSASGGRYAYANGFPSSGSTSNYGVDPIFTVPTSVQPSVVSVSPKTNSSNAVVNTPVRVTFSDSLMGGTYSMTLAGPGGVAVPGSVSIEPTQHTLTFTSTDPLATSTTYTMTVSGARSLVGTLQTAPWTSSFTTANTGQTNSTVTLLPANAVPATVDSGDSGALSLGVRFSSSVDGYVSGVRFYKSAANTGTHTATVWSPSGVALVTATFTNETAFGWQTLTFDQPVAITAGAVYTVSYFAPNGHYSYSGNYFATDYTNAPLTAPGGTNGVFSSAATVFPVSAYNSANYWVDPVVTTGAPPLDSAPPTVASTTPADGATNVSRTANVSATFSEALDPTSVTYTFVDSSHANVPLTMTYDAASRTVSLNPSATLSDGMKYTVSISASDTSGNAMQSPVGWSFTTSGVATCPCGLFDSTANPATVDSGDPSSVTLGVTFRPSVDGYVTGIRFYKAATNTGTHTATLWSAAGTPLATATFGGETATGWQTASFAQPVALTAQTSYVVSYYAPVGHYSVTGNFFATDYTNGPLTAPAGNNGVYATGPSETFPTSSFNASNYWVDPVFMGGTITQDTTPPAITAVAATSDTSTTATITWSTDEPSSSSVAYGTSPGSLTSTATGTGLTTTHSVSISGLTPSTTYYYDVTSTDGAGNSSTSPATSGSPASFVTVAPADTTAPVVSAVSSTPTSATVVVTWSTDENSTSVVQYGTSASSLTSNGGSAALVTNHSVTVTGLTPTTQYYFRVVSADAAGNSTTSPATSDAPATFTTSTPPDTTPPVVTAVSSAPTSTTAVVTWSTDENSTSAVQYGTAAASLTSNASAGSLVTSHSVTVTGLTPSTQYYFRVVSADAAGNSATSPATSGSPATFTTSAPPDTTPPVISAVAVAGSGTSATVTWKTDENASTTVTYGTSTGALTKKSVVAGLATSHSVTLTGLVRNTRYYFRVTSADAAGNSATSPNPPTGPASYAPTVAPFIDTTTADFAKGAAASTYATADGDGGVVLAPSGGAAEFSGTTLPSGFSCAPTAFNGKCSVASGKAAVIGATLTSSSTVGAGTAIETSAVLGLNERLGFTTSLNSSVAITFSVNSTRQLVATVNDGGSNNAVSVLASNWTAAAHKYRIEWTSTSATFYVDDVQKYSHAYVTSLGSYRETFADTLTTDGSLSVDWARLLPYAGSGTFTSQVFNAGAPLAWDAITWDATVPSGTTLTVQVREGNTATPDATWSAWSAVPASGGAIGGATTYLQYRLNLTTSTPSFVTPTVRSVQLAGHVA